MSAYVLARALPSESGEFGALVAQLRRAPDPSFAFAALHDFLHALSPAAFNSAMQSADIPRLSTFEANYVAAMVEHAAAEKRVASPAWVADIPPLGTPYFATSLKSIRLRLHLLRASPAAFKRRNLFVDSVVGARV